MTDRSTFLALVHEAAKILAPLRKAISSRNEFITFVARLGWNADNIPQPIQDLGNDLDNLLTQLNSFPDTQASLAQIESLRQNVVGVVEGIKDLSSAPESQFPPHFNADNFKNEFPAQLLNYLLVDYLSINRPNVAFALRALGVIRIRYQPATGQRRPFVSYRFQFSNLPQVLEDPSVVFANAFRWGTNDPDYESLFEQLDNLLVYLGFAVFSSTLDFDFARKLEDGVEQSGESVRRALKAVFFERQRTDGSRLAAELALFPLPGDETKKPGLALLPFFNGVLGFRMQLGDDIAVMIDGEFDLNGGVGLVLRPETGLKILLGLDSNEAPVGVEGEAVVRVEFANQNRTPIILIGSPDESRLEVGSVSGSGGLRLDTNNGKQELYTELVLQGGRLIIVTGQSDGFLQRILPSDGLSANLEVVLGLSNLQGFYFRGSGGLEIRLLSHMSLGSVEIQSLTIGLQPKSGAIPVKVGADIEAKLGPLTAVVENVGLHATLSFPGSDGNLGPVHFDLGFKPPTGLGLSIDGRGFKGGGFLHFEPDHERYAGVLELEYQERIELKAIGLLTTRLPSDEPGFSLLIIITSEFTPIPLGLGFTLNGVGGLLGLNRTAKVERLRTGLRDNTLRSVLFPENIIANADRILSDLRQVFPPRDGRFLFGPMARIGWGTPTLITVDLGLLIEVPQPVRLFILGVARALLPDEKAKLLQLQVNFLGEIDFERELFAFDASLFDSKLLAYPLSGDMSARLKWGDSNPNFLLTVGGFHPTYQPPPLGLPALQRLTVQLLSGDNPRLRLETYFAVTSNTAQFGARLELYAGAGKFNVYGFLSFDTLFQFNPFYFIAEVAAMLALRVGSSSIASIQLALTLEGTTPWKARGTATLTLCWFIKIKVCFNKTFGEVRNTRLDDVAVLPLLRAALADKGNWDARIPSGRHLLVSVKEKLEVLGNQVIAQPVGVLEISQRIVPLNIALQKFGHQRSADGNRFAIEQVRVGESGNAETLATSAVQEQFAPAQFFEMSDTAKLSRKSFERYDAGVRITDSERLEAAYGAKRDVSYELFYIDSQRNQRLRPWFELLEPEVVTFNAWAGGGAVAASPLSFANNGKSALAPEAVRVSQEPFAVVNTSDLTLANSTAVASSEAEAFGLMRGLIGGNPALEGALQVVPAFEINQ